MQIFAEFVKFMSQPVLAHPVFLNHLHLIKHNGFLPICARKNKVIFTLRNSLRLASLCLWERFEDLRFRVLYLNCFKFLRFIIRSEIRYLMFRTILTPYALSYDQRFSDPIQIFSPVSEDFGLSSRCTRRLKKGAFSASLSLSHNAVLFSSCGGKGVDNCRALKTDKTCEYNRPETAGGHVGEKEGREAENWKQYRKLGSKKVFLFQIEYLKGKQVKNLKNVNFKFYT